jgi:hypothetical protein
MRRQTGVIITCLLLVGCTNGPSVSADRTAPTSASPTADSLLSQLPALDGSVLSEPALGAGSHKLASFAGPTRYKVAIVCIGGDASVTDNLHPHETVRISCNGIPASHEVISRFSKHEIQLVAAPAIRWAVAVYAVPTHD